MNSFHAGVLQRSLSPTLLPDLVRIHRLQGRLDTVRAAGSHRMLDLLQETVAYESTLASLSVERIPPSRRQASAILLGRTTPKNEDETRLLLTRDAYASIHGVPLDLSLPEALAHLYRITWKVREVPRKTRVRKGGLYSGEAPLVDPVDAHFDAFLGASSATMKDIQLLEADRQRAATIMPEPLLAIATTVYDFLQLRPFPDGNGRVARMLTLYLLRQAGFTFVDYVPLDIEHAGVTGYIDALHQSSGGWSKGKQDPTLWWGFFLRMLSIAAMTLEEHLTPEGEQTRTDHVRQVILGLPHQFTVGDVEQALPTVSRTTISRVLRQMRIRHEISKVQIGRNAKWRHGLPTHS